MANAFYNKSMFDTNINDWDVSNVSNIHNMINGASIFNQNLD